MNNPHKEAMPLELCTNVCSAMSWVDWEMTDLPGGYMYCCDLAEAAAALEVKEPGLFLAVERRALAAARDGHIDVGAAADMAVQLEVCPGRQVD